MTLHERINAEQGTAARRGHLGTAALFKQISSHIKQLEADAEQLTRSLEQSDETRNAIRRAKARR